MEIGPGRDLSTMVIRHRGNSPEQRQQVVNLVRHPEKKVSDIYYLLNKIGRLWLYGVRINWLAFYSQEQRYRISLPTYPFERKRYWIEGDFIKPGMGKLSDLNAQMQIQTGKDTADWFSIPSWTRAPLLPVSKSKIQEKHRWLVFLDTHGIGSLFIEGLKQNNEEVITAAPGSAFKKTGTHTYMMNPSQSDDYNLLFHELASQDKLPDKIIHFWGVCHAEKKEQAPGCNWFEQAQATGFYSLL